MGLIHGVTLDELKELEILKFVALESIEGILDACSVREIRANEILLNLNQTNHSLHFVLTGRMRIQFSTTNREPLTLLGPGEIIGEMSLIDRQGASAFVVADTDSRILVMEETLLWSLVQVSHAAAYNLLNILTRRLRDTNLLISERMQLEHEFHRYGTADSLTGLHNRHWFDQVLPRQLSRAEQGGESLVLLMLDIDNFKGFNDRHGHLSGDRAIHLVGRILMDHLRPTELSARYGGDEFVVILPNSDLEKGRLAAERLRQTVMDTEIKTSDGELLPVMTISLGLAQSCQGGAAEELLAAADAALYRAKAGGRNTVST